MNRKYIYYLFIAIIVSTLAVSCTDDELVKNSNRHNIVPGIPVTLSLNMDVNESITQTRAAQSDETERLVNELFVIAFMPSHNADGSENKDAPDEEWTKDHAEMFVIDQEITGSHSIRFSMTTGYRKIYAIANPESGAGTLDEETLNKVNTIAELKALESRLVDKQSIERMNFKMSGQAIADGTKSEILTVGQSTNGNGFITENYNFVLNRVDARISFKITTPTGVDFIPESYRVMNIPGGTYVFPRKKNTTVEEGEVENTWDLTTAGYANGNQTSDFSHETDGSYLFEFYLCENRQVPKRKITTSTQNATLYAMREKQEKTPLDQIPDGEKGSVVDDQTVKNGAYVYAHDKSTYVVLEGTLTYKNNEAQTVYTRATYTIHLGATGNNASDGENWLNNSTLANNYDTQRNTHYTYNVHIQSADQIIVEVDQNQEQNPGAEGDVIISQGDVKTLDSHYGRILFSLKRKDILNGLSWAVTTPFQKGMKVFKPYAKPDGESGVSGTAYLPDGETEIQTFGLEQTDLSLNDYKWVKFAINRECLRDRQGPMGTDVMVKYPGENAYNGGGTNNTDKAPIAGGEYIRTAYYNQVRMYDVNQLLNFLYNAAIEDEQANEPDESIFEGTEAERNVTITAFIDEYIYVYDPSKIYYRPAASVGNDETSTEGIDLSLWKKTVNGSNRMLNFCVEGSKYSEDGQSSVARAVYSIAQHPVYTFYNPDHEGLTTAWGTESVIETAFLPIVPENGSLGTFYDQTNKLTNTLNNGRNNTLNIINVNNPTLRWTNVLGVVTDVDGQLNSAYESVWYACLLRNRDLDGDDVVDADEIRWYLASADQLTDLWIGEAAVPKAKLYMGEIGKENEFKEGTTRVHVASSSYYVGQGNAEPFVIWAEESASRGGANYSSTYGVTKFAYRCVRNLGLSLANIDHVPQDYVTPTRDHTHTVGGETYNEYRIDVSPMMDNAIRPSLGGNAVLPPNTERDASNNNRPPLTLAIINDQIYPKDDNGNLTSINAQQIVEQENTYRPCPDGYRVPNQREMMLIYTTFPELMAKGTVGGTTNFLCNTSFSYVNEPVGFEDYYKKYKRSFIFTANTQNFRLSNEWESGYIRCVRDATDNPGGN